MTFELVNKKILQIEPTTSCALACPQCARYVDDGINPLMTPAELSVADIERLCPTDWVKNLEKMFLCGNYGEPVAAKECIEILKWFRKINPNIVLGINTSGSLRNPEWWAELATILNGPLDYVVFSIDGLEDTNHIYRRNSSWHKIISNAKSFIAAGGSAHWDMLVFEHNKHQVTEAENFAKELGFNWFRTKYTDRPITKNIQWLKKVPDLQPTDVKNANITCHYETTNQAYLSATGQWMPCCYIAGKFEYPDSIGDEIRDTFSAAEQVTQFDKIHQSTAWESIWKRWNSNPLQVCVTNCSTVTGQPVVLDKWRKEIQLK